MNERREVEPGCGFLLMLGFIFGALFACALQLEKIARALVALVPK